MSLSPRELMRMHIDALYTHDAAGDLLCVNEAAGGGPPAPRFFLGATEDGCLLRFRRDATPAFREELSVASEQAGLTSLAATPSAARYEGIVGRYAPVNKTWSGPAFTFGSRLSPAADTALVDTSSATLLESLLSAWIPDVPTCQPMVVHVVDGKAVSICASVRVTDEAHEAGVDTAQAYRGHGYAALVAATWAVLVRDLGRIPLYSTSWKNAASRSVARKLSLIHFGNDLHIT